jgi:hypothetical protein
VRFGSITTALLCLLAAAPATAREWSDSTGHYKIEADLIGFNDTTVVLKKKNHRLVSAQIKLLSDADQKYLASEEAAAEANKLSDSQQTWTMKSGLKVIGKVVNYARRDITLQRIRGKIYVNDKLFDNLDGVYQQMVPKIVSHFEMTEIDGKKGLDAWIMKLKGAPKSFTCEGVMLQLESGDLYGVPFFFFSDSDLKILEPGWQRWLAAEKSQEDREKERFALEKQAQAYQANQQASQQMMQLQLQLQAYQAGLFDLWEVALFPAPGTNLPPQLVVVPGRDSDQATAAAIRQYPGYIVDSIAKVTRKY